MRCLFAATSGVCGTTNRASQRSDTLIGKRFYDVFVREKEGLFVAGCMSAPLETRESLAARRATLFEQHWPVESTVPAVSMADQLVFLRYYLQQLSVLNGALVKLPWRVQACASIFFRRFYLVHSINEHHPKHAMLACLFLASKVQETRMDAATICRRANKASWDKDVLKVEIPLLQALQFRLVVPMPHVAVVALLHELSEMGISVGRAAVDEAINAIMTTDAGLLYSGGDIAAACVLHCVEKEADRKRAAEALKRDEKTMGELSELLYEGKATVTSKQVTPVEKTLSTWTKANKKKKKKTKQEPEVKKEKGVKREKPEESEATVQVKVEVKQEVTGEFEIRSTIKRPKTE